MMDCGLIIEVLLVGLLPPAVPAVGEGERGEVPVEVETGVGLGLCWPAARAELLGTAAAAAYIAPAPGGRTGPGSGLRLLLRTEHCRHTGDEVYVPKRHLFLIQNKR